MNTPIPSQMLWALILSFLSLSLYSCGAIFMSRYQHVEFVSVPPGTRIESASITSSHTFESSEETVILIRSRWDQTAQVYCGGEDSPRSLTLHTYPNLAFVGGNLFLLYSLFFIGYLVDSFFSGGWDYREPVDLAVTCPSASSDETSKKLSYLKSQHPDPMITNPGTLTTSSQNLLPHHVPAGQLSGRL